METRSSPDKESKENPAAVPDLSNVPSLQSLLGRNWCTIDQLAKILEREYRTVLRYIKDGKIAAVKVGGTWRIYEDELRRFLTEGNK